MTHDSTEFDFSLETNFDEFDSLEDRAEEPTGSFAPFTGTVDMPPSPSALNEDAESPEKNPEERISELLAAMAPRRKVLLGILTSCLEPRPISEVNAHVDELQKNNASVYTAANLCSLLEKAGAIERTTLTGQPAQDIEREPEVVVVDGIEYLEAHEPPEICWLITDAGRAALEADKPLERLHALLEEDAGYRVIYQRILELCANEAGAKTSAINDAVNDDPLVQKPRFYAPHFIDKLEKCDALTWAETWHTTDVGLAGLEVLAATAAPDTDKKQSLNAAEAADKE